MRRLIALACTLAACSNAADDDAQLTDNGSTLAPVTDPTSTGVTPTTGPDVSTTEDPSGDPTGDPTSSPTGDPTSSPTGDPTSSPTTTTDPTEDPSETTGGSACADPPLWDDGLIPTNTVHVDPDGADAPTCGAEASPCATLGGALAVTTPGTAVVLHAGDYAPDQFLEIQGSEGAPIWIGGAPDEPRPVISGGGEALHLSRPRHVILHDLEIQGASGNGINIDDGGDYADPDAARFVGLRRVSIHDIGGGGNEDCLKLSGLNDYFVVDSEFSACGGGGSGSGIDHVGCHRGTIAGNSFTDVSGNAVQCKGGSADIEIRHNFMREAGERAVNMGGSTGFEFFRPPLAMPGPNAEATDIRVVANVIVGGQAALAFVGCVDCLVADNTIVRPHNWIFRILQETVDSGGYTFLPASGGTFRNNLVVFDRTDLSTYVNIGGNTDPASFTFANNLWYAADDPAQSDPAGDLPTPESAGIVGQDPQLADLPDGDFHLTAASPAVHTGLAPAAAAHDLDGVCFADPPSIGAYELP
jgi:hypothetical protein